MGEDEQLISVGVGAFKDGFYDIAEKQFLSFIHIYPKHEKIYDVYYLLGRTLILRGKWKEAVSVLSKILQEAGKFENMDHVLFGLAEMKTRLGDRDEATRLLYTIIKKYPKFEQIDDCYFLLGLLEFESNQLKAAESTFKKISQTSKKNELIQYSHFWLGMISFKQKNYEKAANYFQDLWEKQKALPKEYLKYALIWLGESYRKTGQFHEAKNHYKTFYQLFKYDPLAAEAFWKEGFCGYQEGGGLKKSIETFQSFLSQYKNSPLQLYTRYLIGKMLMMGEDYLSSIKELNSILTPSLEFSWGGASLLTLYWNYIHLGENDEANRILQRLQKTNHFEDEKIFIQWLNAEILFHIGEVLESIPYYFNIVNTSLRERALFQIGKGYFFENKYREAITNLDILILEFPNSEYLDESLFLKGECLVSLGNLDQALESYELLARQNKYHFWKLFALTQIGVISSLKSDYEKAEGPLKKIMEDFPNHPLFYHAAFLLGNLNFNKHHIIEALHYYSIVLKGNILELLGGSYFASGEIFFQQGKYEKALQSFENAIQYLKETSSLFFLTHLEIGNLKKRGGKPEEAKESYMTIINRSKDEELKRAARELLNRLEVH